MTDDHQELFSGGKPLILGAAGDSRGSTGAASPGTAAAHSALRFQRFPKSFPTFLSVLRVWPAAGKQRTDCSPSISLPGPSPPSCFCLPSPGHWLQPPSRPSSAAGTRTRRHRDFSLPWACQETVPNTSKHSAVMN